MIVDLYLCIYMVLESAHLCCPILLAWSEPDLRRIVKREWGKHLALPAAVMAGVLLVPGPIVTATYFVWNIWHFGMQNFGLSCICRGSPNAPDARMRRALYCVGGTALAMALAFQFRDYLVVAVLATIGLNFFHWITDIELSRRVSRWGWGFLAIVLAGGIGWLLLRQGPLSVKVFPQIVMLRNGLGMVHFIYSARIWKMRDLTIRAFVNRRLFQTSTA